MKLKVFFVEVMVHQHVNELFRYTWQENECIVHSYTVNINPIALKYQKRVFSLFLRNTLYTNFYLVCAIYCQWLLFCSHRHFFCFPSFILYCGAPTKNRIDTNIKNRSFSFLFMYEISVFSNGFVNNFGNLSVLFCRFSFIIPSKCSKNKNLLWFSMRV